LTKSIPDYEIWAGNPAAKIGERKQTEFDYHCSYRRLFR
jgi:acetyltransferase-like isoleucine patch superfamily enzyme